MTLKTRLNKIESHAVPSAADRPDCIYLCALTNDSDAPSDPRVAYLLRGRMGEEVSRVSGESADQFRSRVDSLLGRPA